MTTIRWIGICSLATAVSMLGCSGSGQPGTGFSGGDDAAAAGTDAGGTQSSSSGGGTSSGGSSGGGASSGGSGSSSGGLSGSSSSSSSGSSSGGSSGGLMMSDAAPGSNPEIDYSTQPITLTMTQFTVQPGQEVFYCQNFANPWKKQVDIKTYSLNMGMGSHHMFAFYASNATNGALAACPSGGLTFGPFTFSAQSPQATITYPATVGATLPAATGFQLMVHYLNTTGAPITSSVALTMYIAKPNVVTNHAGSLFLNNALISVPASCTTGCQSTSTYTLPQAVNILSADSHMHKYATNFVATLSTGQTLFQTTQWAEPPAKVYSPPLAIPAGTTITWTCTDVNTTGTTLTFGESANTNVMCISSNIFYPVTDVTNPVLGSQGFCTSPDTPIATPDGERPVASLQVGDLVMSVDHGRVRAVPLVRVSHTPVTNHHVVAVTLANGRVLHISEGHPTAEGRLFRDLAPGDRLGDVPVVSLKSIPYDHDATYDIEPASDTATYFAAGAEIGSTLRFPGR
jgi:hypothetical protein